MNKEIVVIGGGPAGIEAAREAARRGWRVNLVSEGPVGGRAGWHSLLPSKVWLAAAEAALGAGFGDDQAETTDILARVTQVKDSWNGQVKEELEALGVAIVSGHASFTAPDVLVVENGEGQTVASFEGLAVLLASGSVPIFPAALKPDGKRVFAPRFLSHFADLPTSMLVVGAGATGCESAYLFNALGVDVTWIVDQFGILPQIYDPAGAALGRALAGQGVHIVQGHMVEELRRAEGKVTAVLTDGSEHEAEMAFVAIGRRADLGRFNIAEAGIEVGEDGNIVADALGRTSNPLVSIAGDIDGQAMTANKAQAQARIAVLQLSGRNPAPFAMNEIVLPTYTQPQVAQVGTMETGSGAAIKRAMFKESLKSHITGEDEGFVDVAYEKESGRVRGATAVGSHAADIVSAAAVAIRLQGSIDDLTAIYAGYPSFSELSFIAARSAE